MISSKVTFVMLSRPSLSGLHLLLVVMDDDMGSVHILRRLARMQVIRNAIITLATLLATGWLIRLISHLTWGHEANITIIPLNECNSIHSRCTICTGDRTLWIISYVGIHNLLCLRYLRMAL